jgi:hypothetical protein
MEAFTIVPCVAHVLPCVPCVNVLPIGTFPDVQGVSKPPGGSSAGGSTTSQGGSAGPAGAPRGLVVSRTGEQRICFLLAC